MAASQRDTTLATAALALVAFVLADPLSVGAQGLPPPSSALSGASPSQPAQVAPGGESRPASPQGTAPSEPAKRVVYIPESVKAQIVEETKAQVLAQIQEQNWAAPSAVPEWTKRFKPYADVRVRYEANIFPAGNANGGEFPDFNAINTGQPFDVNYVNTANERYLDVDTNRSRFRLRARLGVEVDAGEGFSLGIRIASGDQNTPISPNQTLGGTGGYFSKYQIWLDQAYIRYAPLSGEPGALMIEAGRFENPFFTARDLLWSENVNLDGFALAGAFAAGAGFRPFAVIGASPVYATAFNFPPEQPSKYNSVNKWLFAGQVGTDWKLDEKVSLKLGAALYYFYRISGQVSPSCDTNLANITCSTDDTRPSFAQKGNTYLALRTPSAAALQAEAGGLVPRYQYFGLASQFHEVFATGRLDYRVAPPVVGSLEGEFAWNAGFNGNEIAAVAVNNLGKCDATGKCEGYAGGNYAYVARLTFESPSQFKQWDWNVSLSYLHVESDAIVDAFSNPDFGYGGTNLRGYWVGGRVAVANNITFGLRWMSADNIVGPTYRFDLLQADLWGRF